MLIIKTQDNSSTLLDESFLILSNKETVQVGSKVKFVYQNAIYSGTVSHKSDDMQWISKKYEELDTETEIIANKKNSKANKKKSDTTTKKNKKSETNLTNLSETDKEILNQRSTLQQSITKELANVNKNVTSSTSVPINNAAFATSNKQQDSQEDNDSTREDSDQEADQVNVLDNLCDDNQLFGKDNDEHAMVEITKGLYGRSAVLARAFATSTMASHLARKIVPAVFKLDAVLKSTVSGSPCRSLPQPNVLPEALHTEAVNKIISFSQNYAASKKWPKQTKRAIRNSMSTKCGEIKREFRNAQSQGKNFPY